MSGMKKMDEVGSMKLQLRDLIAKRTQAGKITKLSKNFGSYFKKLEAV